MIVTPKMWAIKQRLDFLEHHCLCDPGDYLAVWERDELRIKYANLTKRGKIGLYIIRGGKNEGHTPIYRRNDA